MTTINATATDIRAKNAYNGTSYTPERREAEDVNGYLAHMAEVADEFSKWETPDNAEALAEDMEAYRSGYAARLNAYLSSHSRVVSQFITGAGGWTGAMIRANDKRIDSADKRRAELFEYREKRLAKLRNRYNPHSVSRQAIRSGDVDALDRLAEKIERLEAFQEAMKDANKIVRGKASDEDKITELVCIDGISERTARDLLKPDYMGRVGFPSFALTNNSANVRRLKERYAEIERKQAEDAQAQESGNAERQIEFDGGYVVDSIEADRYQVYHHTKPTREKIDLLKRYGLRWTPSAGCWQAYRTPNGKRAVEIVTGVAL